MSTPEQSSRESITNEPADGDMKAHRGLRFWLIIVSLSLSLFMAAIELSGVANALPTIANDLQGGDFAWVGTAYALASTSFLPLSGGIAEIFGRRVALASALVIFALGSGLCGAARSMDWLIGARVVQGLGCAGLLSLTNIVISDLVPLHERGKYNALNGMTWSIATVVGPLIGGATSTSGQWRWLFYLNLPIAGIALIMVLAFLRLPTPAGTFRDKFGRLDWIGSIIVVGSTTSLVIGLTWGGVKFSWSSFQVLVPLIIGFCGLLLFILYEATFSKNPIVPITLLQNRTSVSGYIQTFVNAFAVTSLAYYLPAYYQACKDATSFRASVYLLGMSIVVAPFIVIAGISVTTLQAYRPQVWFSWVLMALGAGLLTTIEANTPTARSVGFSIIFGMGIAILSATTYFPVLSPLPVSENAHALAFFAFCRSLSNVWGVSVGATVLQNEIGNRLPESFLNNLPEGRSGVDLSYSIIPLIKTLPQPLKDEVRVAFGESLVVVWQVLVGVVGIGVLASVVMKNVAMHKYVDEKWALEEKRESTSHDSVDVAAKV